MTMQDPAVDEVENTRRRLMEAMRTGSAQDPTALARDRQEAERRGVSVQTLRAARASGATIPNLNWNTLPDRAPRTTAFLSNPANAAAAHDDVDNMSSVENLIRGVSSRAVNLGAGLGRALFTAVDAPADALARGTQALGLPAGIQVDARGNITFTRLTEDDFAARGGRGTSNLLQRGENTTLGYTPMTTWDDFKESPVSSFIPYALETGIVSAPDMAAAVLALPAYVAARTGEIGQDRANNNGQSQASVQDLITVLPAAVASSALERLGARGVLGLDDAVRGGARGIPRAAAAAGVKEAGTEAAQGAVEYTATNLGTEAGFDPMDAAEQALAGAVAGAGFGTTVRGVTAGAEVATNRMAANQASANVTEQEGSVIDRLNALAEASALRQRDPQTFQQFIDEAADGTDIEAVYVDAQTFAQSFNAETLTALTEAVPEIAEQLDAAIATGGDLRIPTGAFAAHIAGTEAAAPLLEHLKIDPFAQSRAQAREFLKNQGEELRAEIEAAAAAGQMDEAFVASKDVVRDRVASELDTVGRFSSDVNRAYATVLSDFYAVQAANLGITPEQMAERYPLKFSGELPGGQGRTTLDQTEELDLVHFSGSPGLTESDPSRWGANRSMTTREEANRRTLGAPGRTYFGIRGGYQGEAGIRMTSPFEYSARVPAGRVYDMDADPENLRPEGEQNAETASAYEAAIQAAGFGGYRSAQMGGVVAMFEPTPLEMTGAVQTVEEARAVDARMRELQRDERMARARANTTNEITTAQPLENFRAQAMADVMPDRVFGQSAITPDQADAKARKLAEEIPGLKGVLPYLSTDEKAKLRRDTATKITKMIEDFPDAEEMAAVAYSGRAKRGWYENSAQAILSIFGAADAPRFAALLAALSPQTSVEANAFNALATWTNWINAGRPQDQRTILRIMGESVQGKGTEESVLNAWVNNSVTALTTENPGDITLSGPKVNSFMMNLVGVVDEVTNDAWMANYALVEQSVFKKTGAVPGKGPGYMAMNAVARRAAEIVSEKTGDDWTAAEVQETVWSWAKTLYEMRDSAGEKRTAPEILAAGGLTADDIASTPDFAVLFVDGVFRRILEAGGYGAELDALDARGQPARRDGGGSLDPGSVEGTGFDEGDFTRYVDQAAARLEELRARRQAAAQAKPDQLSLFAQGPIAEELPLEGQPQVVNIPGRGRTRFGPFAKARLVAREYMRGRGWPYSPPTVYAKVDEARAKRIADAFEAMKHNPNDPQVAEAYRLMIDETLAQWQAIKATGLKVEFIRGEDPYAATPRLAILDVTENNHLWVFPTDDGFGSSELDVSDNPLLELTDEYIDGVQLRANDVFRIVHDYFGHIKDGNGFRADGEENAWQSHAAMYSPLARRAMTTETRGQNSWVNFGPKAEFNRTASASETVYADQKIGLLPEWVSTEGFLGDTASYAQADVFYSALERAVLNSSTAKAPAAQWKATLAKTPGVKKEELEWSGINDWLDAITDPETGSEAAGAGLVDAKGNITREDVAAFLRVGGVQLDERVLGDGPSASWLQETMTSARRMARATLTTIDGLSEEDAAAEIAAYDFEAAARDEFAQRELGGTQFGTYKLPGADDTYREILLTLPKIEGPSTHWDEENVVAHARITTREDATGARVLFLEEVQSDWHQKGRDQGYHVERTRAEQMALEDAYEDSVAAFEAARAALRDGVEANLEQTAADLNEALAAPTLGENLRVALQRQLIEIDRGIAELRRGLDPTRILSDQVFPVSASTAEIAPLYRAFADARLANAEAFSARDTASGIPDAPFRTSWSTLVMKRMIRYAADNGYDKVAWINGNQQNGGQTGGDGSFFYERNLVNTTNDLLKKLGGRVEKVDMVPADERAEAEETRAGYETQLANSTSDAATEYYTTALRQLESVDRPAKNLGLQNGFTITDQMREAAGQGFPLFQDNRGQIAFGADITQTPSVISVLRTADLSTFLHETGHFFLEVTTHIANQADAPAGIKADMGAVFSWFGEGMDLARWNTMTTEERRPYHEQFARGFEAYLFEGRAPSPALRSLFRRFSAWLKNVYKSLTALNVELTDEVRSVFDRMLASADDIRVAEQARSFAPMMTEKPETMSADEWKRYQELGIEATQEAIETLEQRNLRDMQWASNAKSRALRALQREANEQRKAVRAEVTAEVEAEPVNRARAFLRRGVNAEGEQVEGAAKLDIDTMRELYGEDGVWTGLKRGGKYGDAGNDGLHPDVVAEMFGFANGESLIEALVNGPNPRDQITGMTDQRMLERYGDLSTPEALERAANEAVANDARLKFLSAEGAALDKAVGRRSILNEAAREYAASVVNRLMLKRLRPAQYLAAQGRAAKASEQAFRKGDLAAAATAKRNQLVNLHTGRAVQKAQREVEKSMRLFKRIVTANNDALSKSRNMDLVNAARAVLMAHGMGRTKNNAAGYMEAVSKYDPTLFADLNPLVLGATSNALPMENITYEQFVALRDTVSSLWELAKRSRQIEVDGKLVDITVAATAMTERMDAIKPVGEQPGQTRAVTDSQERDRDLLGARAALRRVESWARGLDGADKGPFRTYIWSMISQAADRYRAESNTYIRRFRELLDTVRADLKPKDIAAPELGYVFGGKSELYHALLHTGNGSNKSKLLLGRKWGRKLEDGSLDDTRWQAFIDRLHTEGVLTQKDWTFVQAVWDLMEETKPGAQKAHRQVYGRYFDEIAADPVDTPFGQLRGGYVPAMTDAFMVQDAALRAEQEAIEGGDSAMFPAASNGFTKSRVEDYTRELALDLRLLPMHIDKVLKFTHLGPPVRDVMRVLKNRAFSARLSSFDPTAQTDLLLPWLQRAAKQLVQTPTKGRAGKGVDRFFNVMRQRVGMQLMFGNVLNTAQQVMTGWAPAMLRVGKGPMSASLWRFMRNPDEFSKQATSLSTFLKNRSETDVFEARQQIAQLAKLNPNAKDEFVAFVTRHTYFMQSAVQNVMDVVIWGAAYDQASQRGDAQDDAVRFADSVIRETQGSMSPEDISRFETGTPFVRMFTQFAGYFNLMANLNATEVQIVARGVGYRKGTGRLWYIYLMGMAIPALVGDAVMQIGRGGWDDEDEDGYADDLFAWFFSSQAKFALAAVPVIGQVANAALATANDKPYDDRISMSPAVSVLEGGLKTPSETYQTLVEGESFNQSDTRNALNLIGILTGTPTGVLAKPIGYGAGVAAGDVEPTSAADAVRGVVTGAASPASKQ